MKVIPSPSISREAPKPNWERLFVAVAVVAWGFLLILGRGLTFAADEWFFVAQRSLDPGSWWQPFNEHWSAIPILVYQVLLHTVGLASYLPYLGLELVAHILVAAAVFRLVERSSGGSIGFAAGCLVALFGNGFENLFWAFQLGYVGSIAAGLWALVVLREPATRIRATLAACLLLIAVASGPGGPILLVAGLVVAATDRTRRRYLLALMVPFAAYAAWYVINRPSVAPYLGPGALTIQSAADYPAILLWGIASSVGAIIGIGPVAGACVAVLAGWRGFRRGNRAMSNGGLPAAMTSAVALEMYLIAAARGNLGASVVASPRYLYLTVPLIMVGITAWIGQPKLPEVITHRRFILATAAAAYSIALALNVARLGPGREPFTHEADLTRAIVIVIEDTPPAKLRLDLSLGSMPTVGEMRLAIQHFGSPGHDWLGPDVSVPQDLLYRVRAVMTLR
jgi:hypothetical protein